MKLPTTALKIVCYKATENELEKMLAMTNLERFTQKWKSFYRQCSAVSRSKRCYFRRFLNVSTIMGGVIARSTFFIVDDFAPAGSGSLTSPGRALKRVVWESLFSSSGLPLE